MPFQYVAATNGGKLKRGFSELASRDAVIQDLEARGLVVVSVDEVKRARSSDLLSGFLLGTISHVDKVLFTKHLSVMLRAGLSLLESMQILVEQTQSWRFRVVIKAIHRRIERGEKFSDALAAFPQVFSPFYVNIVRAGELSGTMEENLDHLAVQFAKEHALRQKVRTALTYPTIVLVAAAFIGFFFATYVLPQVANLFTGLQGIKLPWVTVVLLRVSAFARKYTFLSFFGLFGGLYFVYWFMKRKFLQPFTHTFVLKMPVIDKIVKDVNLARFSLVFGTLMRSGIDITKALEVTSTVLGNMYYRRAMGRILIEVQRGQPLSESMLRYPDLFPRIVSRMVGVGERAGKLEEVLGYLSEFYELEVETTMKNLQTVLEPVLLLFIGMVALGMAFAILIPIYNFIAAIRRL
ncbi:MAG TPA: type II secretion system F family protein [Candidatus Eisenbacteria bacterium]|nr:type II secretion system F family protein [Candidatus Eisenbacteria bacterium]